MASSKTKADLKVIILGAARVGKTCLIQRYLHGTFESTKATIGASFFLKHWDGYHVAIWDTAGEEKYHALSSFYARNASAAILAYDITDVSSFHSLQKSYLHLLDAANPKCLCAVVACKSDLVPQHGRNVDVSTAMEFAREHNQSRGAPLPVGCPNWDSAYFETSSKTGDGVQAVFDFLQRTLLQGMPPAGESATSLPPSIAHTLAVVDRDRGSVSANDKEQSKGCCS
ncbi:ras-related protein Rab-20-like [Sycon ciliatum]|uniref:ras-related protein Rab-20-like n=1 Tax=Sycon ciliatum TaxID=27933 RepID=UPI0020AA1DBC|eukprot:scpid90602/ scgid7140/ Ras-related protein Rab-20